jgi:hypothetical protein
MGMTTIGAGASTAEGLVHRPPSPAPEEGQLARVRERMWVVAGVAPDAQAARDGRTVQHLVSLVSVEDDATGEELEVVWEIEPGTQVIERARLPALHADRLDDPAQLDAFLDAVRCWTPTASRAASAPRRRPRARSRSAASSRICATPTAARASRCAGS